MGCYSPLSGFYSGRLTDKGKPEVIVQKRQFFEGADLRIPCGQCIGCRLERSRQWAVRCCHEASLHDENCFITLTYAPEFLPKDGSLDLRHFQLFMKKLRFEYGSGIRFFHCGEYGENFGRPHYHAILFNFNFPDRELITEEKGYREFESKALSRLWGMGICHLGEFSFESAAYVARYCTKKVNGRMAEDHYSYVDLRTGELIRRKPEYCTMSRRPGIGFGWFEKFSSDVFPKDSFHLNGKELRPPKFYDRKLEELDLDLMNEIRLRRIENLDFSDSSRKRLTAKEAVAQAQFKQFAKRRFEGD